jgi:hypothetical protein
MPFNGRKHIEMPKVNVNSRSTFYALSNGATDFSLSLILFMYWKMDRAVRQSWDYA